MPGESDLFRAVSNHKESWRKTNFPTIHKEAKYPGEVPLLVKASKVLKLKIVPDSKKKNNYDFQIDHNDIERWHSLCVPRTVNPMVRKSGGSTQYFTALESVIDRLSFARNLTLQNLLLGPTINSKTDQGVVFQLMADLLVDTGVETIDEANNLNDEILELAKTQDENESVEIFKDGVSFSERVKALKGRAALEPADHNGNKPSLVDFVERLRTLQDAGHEDRVRDVVEGTMRTLPGGQAETWTLDAAEKTTAGEHDQEKEGEVK